MVGQDDFLFYYQYITNILVYLAFKRFVMRNTFLLLLSSLFLFACCKSDDNMPTPDPNIPEVEKLPPATQTGANTVGCLVNDMAFLPSGSLTGSSNPYCGYYYDSFVLVFSIVKNKENITGNGTESVAIYIDETILEEGIIYLLHYNETGRYAAFDIIGGLGTIPDESYETN